MKCSCPLSGRCETHGLDLTPEQHRQCREDDGMYEAFAAAGERKRMPSIFRRAANATRAAGRVAKAAATGKKITVDAATLAQRKTACGQCDHEAAGWCGKCGCALSAKQRLATEACPLGLWPTVDPAAAKPASTQT